MAGPITFDKSYRYRHTQIGQLGWLRNPGHTRCEMAVRRFWTPRSTRSDLASRTISATLTLIRKTDCLPSF